MCRSSPALASIPWRNRPSHGSPVHPRGVAARGRGGGDGSRPRRHLHVLVPGVDRQRPARRPAGARLLRSAPRHVGHRAARSLCSTSSSPPPVRPVVDPGPLPRLLEGGGRRLLDGGVGARRPVRGARDAAEALPRPTPAPRSAGRAPGLGHDRPLQARLDQTDAAHAAGTYVLINQISGTIEDVTAPTMTALAATGATTATTRTISWSAADGQAADPPRHARRHRPGRLRLRAGRLDRQRGAEPRLHLRSVAVRVRHEHLRRAALVNLPAITGTPQLRRSPTAPATSPRARST